jgi:hypothetical protein
LLPEKIAYGLLESRVMHFFDLSQTGVEYLIFGDKCLSATGSVKRKS